MSHKREESRWRSNRDPAVLSLKRLLTSDQWSELECELQAALPCWDDMDTLERFYDDCGEDHAHTDRILWAMGLGDKRIKAVVANLKRLGGSCDCEVLEEVMYPLKFAFMLAEGEEWTPKRK